MATRKPLVLVDGQLLELPVGDDIGIFGGAGGVHIDYPIPVNDFAHLGMNALGLTTIAAAANRLDMLPFIPRSTKTYDQMTLEVTGSIAGSLGRLGIYADDGAGKPTELLLQGATTIDCASPGNKIVTITPTALSAGVLYWLAIASSSNQTYRGIGLSALMPLAGNSNPNAMYSLLRATATFASGLPANAPAMTRTAAVAPNIRLRRSA